MELRQNQYVKSATSHMVSFTTAFREKFWHEYHSLGRSPEAIIRDMGFSPGVIGGSRLRGIVQHLRERVQSGDTFSDVRKSPIRSATLDKDKSGKPLPPSKALQRLQHEVSYLRQEMEFVKKIILADKAAKPKC